MNSICEHECYPHGVSTEKAVDWIFFIDTINFCFWTPGPGKWDVSYKGKLYTGYFALCAAVARALDDGVDLIDPKVYSKLTQNELAHILRSESKKEIPLLKERLDCLSQVGKILLQKYQGNLI
ncbi:hypothetical protein AAG570_008525 [Ranatra chinensis]|uniref:Queuosine 5'-phosphate N-glycosylase/hydrolase n=1 Tax=Ranatra chinensis TaxID=642074 RepID=A0ABD0Z1W7_9HEMI